MGPSTFADPTPRSSAETSRPGAARDRLAAQTLATEIARTHGEALLRTARRYSESADDAHDAYQRALMLLLEHAGTVDRTKAVAWMHVVVRREAGLLRRRHDRHIPFDVDAVDELQLSDRTDDELSRIDLAQRAGEALATLTDTEAQALCLRAQGLSYEEIADTCGWSYTKVNRAVSEGRRAFIDHYLGAERGEICGRSGERIGAYLAGELRARDHVRLKAHLTRCPACRAQLHAERGAAEALRALLPPVVAASTRPGWIHDHLLGPITDLAGRLAPAADHALNAKLGVAAASVAALAGGSAVAIEQRAPTPAPPALRATLASDAAPRSAAGSGGSPSGALVAAVDTAAASGARIADTARERAARAQRRAAARRTAAARRRARTAAAREFSPATTEFSGAATATSARRSTTASTTEAGSSTAPAPASAAPSTVDTSASDADADIAVTDLSGTP